MHVLQLQKDMKKTENTYGVKEQFYLFITSLKVNFYFGREVSITGILLKWTTKKGLFF